MCAWLASLLLALNPGVPSQEDKPIPVENWPPPEGLEAHRRGFDPLRPVPPRPLDTGPMRLASDHYFHALFGLLPMESADTLEEDRFDVQMREEFSSGDLEVLEADYVFRYRASRLRTSLTARLGLHEDWEVGAETDISNLLEDKGDIVLLRRGVTLVRQAGRSTGVGDVRLWTKKRLFSIADAGALGLAVGLKVPVSRSKTDLLTSGGVDLAGGLLWSQALGAFNFHVNFGAIIPGELQVFEEDVDTRNGFTFGTAVAYQFAEWGAAVAQVQGNQSVFEDSRDSIEIFDKPAVAAHLGGRFRLGSFFLEAGAGTGLTDQSSDLVLHLSMALPL